MSLLKRQRENKGFAEGPAIEPLTRVQPDSCWGIAEAMSIISATPDSSQLEINGRKRTKVIKDEIPSMNVEVDVTVWEKDVVSSSSSLDFAEVVKASKMPSMDVGLDVMVGEWDVRTQGRVAAPDLLIPASDLSADSELLVQPIPDQLVAEQDLQVVPACISPEEERILLPHNIVRDLAKVCVPKEDKLTPDLVYALQEIADDVFALTNEICLKQCEARGSTQVRGEDWISALRHLGFREYANALEQG